MKLLICSLILLPALFVIYQTENTDSQVISAFKQINPDAKAFPFSNASKINNNGGHIQGIQPFKNEHGSYIFMTGSSDTYSYLAVVKNDEDSKIVSVNRLMEKPFKHAGGFQIYDNWLAVGIEDNSAKNKSKVCIYDISNPEQPVLEPIAIIERAGEPLRSTAGCVSITEHNDKILLAVGDWDTKNIDFYTGSLSDYTNRNFEFVGTIDTDKQNKSGWSDKNWIAYQNINLFNINNRLYLVGLGQNSEGENIADLYRMDENNQGNFALVKLSSGLFNCECDCTFKAAAGAEYQNGQFKIYAFGYHISETSCMNIFAPNFK